MMMDEMRHKQKESQKDQSSKLKPLQKELDTLKQNSERLFEAQISGSYQALAGAIAKTKKGTLGRVPTFASNWLLDLGSNQGHTD